MSAELVLLGITELGALIRNKAASPVDVLEATLRRIETLDPVLHAYLTLPAEDSLRAARAAEADIAAGRYRGPLHGVPVAVKDLCATRGVRTTLGPRYSPIGCPTTMPP